MMLDQQSTLIPDRSEPGLKMAAFALVIEILQDICNNILKTGIWPEDWTTSILIPIPKKASFKCSDHRTINA